MGARELTDDPLATVEAWLATASSRSSLRNPLAMALATSTPDGTPSVRMVLLRGFSAEHGYLVFYTNYGSRKARELTANARAAAALYWEEFGGRQLRFEGPILRSPPGESDAYFATRPLASQVNAWVSEQSAPIDKMQTLHERANAKAAELGIDADLIDDENSEGALGRPPFWGGYRLWIDTVELWSEGKGRFHERICYTRKLDNDSHCGFIGRKWQRQRLQP